jgi:hypothetical protein
MNHTKLLTARPLSEKKKKIYTISGNPERLRSSRIRQVRITIVVPEAKQVELSV